MKKIYLLLIQFFLTFVAASIILSTTLFTLIYAESSVVSSETQRIRNYLSQKLQYPLEVKSIALRFHGIMPVIDIENFVVFSKDQKQIIFSVGELSARIKILKSLFTHQVLLNYLYINHLNLLFLKNQNNQWESANLTPFLNLFNDNSNKGFSNNFTFEGEHLGLGITGMFPDYLPIDHFKTKLSFYQNESGQYNVILNKLDIQNQDLHALGQASWVNQKFNFNLNYYLNASLPKKLNSYLPHNFLDPDLLRWLTSSIKSFDQIQGIATLENGSFIAQFEVKNLLLNYDPDWPSAKKIDAQIIFRNNSLDANVLSGVISDSELQNIKVSIPDLEKSILNIEGRISTPGKNYLTFIAQSPLKKTIGKFFENISWQNGSPSLILALHIPLADQKAKTTLHGEVNLLKSRIKLFNRFDLQNVNGNIIFNEEGLTGKSVAATLSGKPVNIEISPLKYFVRYQQLNLTVTQKNTNEFHLSISDPKVAGGIDVLENGIRGTLDYLYVDKDDQKNNTTNTRPDNIPPLNIVINDFKYGEKKFGKILLKTVQMKSGLQLNELQANLGATNIKMGGSWKNNNISQVQGHLMSRNVAETLKNWNLPNTIQSDSARLNYQLNWRGSLYSPDIKTLSGNIQINIGSGGLSQVSSAKADFGRLLTILSFQSLAKRMQFDFSDFKNTGLNFDSIQGTINLMNGIARINSLILEGPIASIVITGSIDIIHSTYNLRAEVTPHLTSSLPVIATIAGGPVAGAATWAAGKIFNPILNKITTDIYTVTGSWDNPIVKQV